MARAASEDVRREARALRIELLRDLGRHEEADELASHPVIGDSIPSNVMRDETVIESLRESVARANSAVQGSSFGAAGAQAWTAIRPDVGSFYRPDHIIVGSSGQARSALISLVGPGVVARVVGNAQHRRESNALELLVTSIPTDIVDVEIGDVHTNGTQTDRTAPE